ncbi:MAG TPA: YHS domain-containing protein [Novimethylophilus sp.]|uniref:YHS domain-containing protein n=1 Tax=Novimethylophilus sp. TaxID=2137426 RepID=UPI002F3EB296
MTELVQDPVCRMQVPAASFAAEHAGIIYAFCSVQCRDRFLANPHLYIGFPGRKAPAQEGLKIVKCRRIRFAYPLDTTQAKRVQDALTGKMGVQDVHIEDDKMDIQYDLIQVTEEQLENELTSVGIALGQGWAHRLKYAFIHFEEEFEIGNLEVTKNKKGGH